MRPKFAKGQTIRVVRAPEWDTSCEGAFGVVERQADDANSAGTGWEVGVRLEIDGKKEGWCLGEEFLEAVPPVLPVVYDERTCLAPDGSMTDEFFTSFTLRDGTLPAGLLESLTTVFSEITGGRCAFTKSKLRTDTLMEVQLLWCRARPIGQILTRIQAVIRRLEHVRRRLAGHGVCRE